MPQYERRRAGFHDDILELVVEGSDSELEDADARHVSGIDGHLKREAEEKKGEYGCLALPMLHVAKTDDKEFASSV